MPCKAPAEQWPLERDPRLWLPCLRAKDSTEVDLLSGIFWMSDCRWVKVRSRDAGSWKKGAFAAFEG
jgi:hypothetical protein